MWSQVLQIWNGMKNVLCGEVKMIHTSEKVTAQVFNGQGDNKLAGSDD